MKLYEIQGTWLAVNFHSKSINALKCLCQMETIFGHMKCIEFLKTAENNYNAAIAA